MGESAGQGGSPGLEKAGEAQTRKAARRGARVSKARRQRSLGQVWVKVQVRIDGMG